jgi:hypothetical protein
MAAWVKNTAIGIVLIAAVMALTGCGALFVGAAGGAVAGALYYQGELKADVDATPQAVVSATEKAFRDLIWSKEVITASDTGGLATARTATGKAVEVTVKTNSPDVSSVGIRIGTFGDENLSRLLYDRILFFLNKDSSTG